MSIREAIRSKPQLAMGIALGSLALALVYLGRNSFSNPTIPNAAYFSTDNGKTTFVDSLEHFPPFDHDGKPASLVVMYSCDGGKTSFPGYLQRYTTAAKARLESQLASFKSGASHNPPMPGPSDTEVKKCDDTSSWVNTANFAEAAKITTIHCPNGGQAEPVEPQ